MADDENENTANIQVPRTTMKKRPMRVLFESTRPSRLATMAEIDEDESNSVVGDEFYL